MSEQTTIEPRNLPMEERHIQLLQAIGAREYMYLRYEVGLQGRLTPALVELAKTDRFRTEMNLWWEGLA